MGCDIHSFAEVKVNGKWLRVIDTIFDEGTKPFGFRNFNVFSFLANVQNSSAVPEIFPLKGLPADSEYLNSSPEDLPASLFETVMSDHDYHSYSHLTLDELLSFDYNSTFEDRKCEKVIGSGVSFAETAPAGSGIIVRFIEFLPTSFFYDINTLVRLSEPENVRVVFWFDN